MCLRHGEEIDDRFTIWNKDRFGWPIVLGSTSQLQREKMARWNSHWVPAEETIPHRHRILGGRVRTNSWVNWLWHEKFWVWIRHVFISFSVFPFGPHFHISLFFFCFFFSLVLPLYHCVSLSLSLFTSCPSVFMTATPLSPFSPAFPIRVGLMLAFKITSTSASTFAQRIPANWMQPFSRRIGSSIKPVRLLITAVPLLLFADIDVT